MDTNAAIAIVDCNNFYASCERVVNPELQNRPVVVLSHNDGIIVSRSNEVKALGVPNASPFFHHRELLERHNTAVISCNHALYYEVSHRVMDVLNEDCGANKIELYSIDEAFIDVAGLWRIAGTPTEIAARLRQRVADEVGQAFLDVQVNVFELQAPFEAALLDLGADLGEPALDVGPVLRRDHALRRQHLGMRQGAGDVGGRQALVEQHAGRVALHQLAHRLGEQRRPGL